MRTLSIQGLPDKRRQKVLVHDWPEPEGPTGNEVKTETIYSGITNGTERNQLIGGNYAPKDEQLPTGGGGYQNVGRVIEVGAAVSELQIGDVLYMSAVHAEYVVMPEDGLLIKLPDSIDRKEAALFGMTSVAMRSAAGLYSSCRNAELQMGERVLIVGAGIIGQVAAQIATSMGARATLCDINVIPLAHHENVYALPDELAGRIAHMVRRVAVASTGYPCDGVSAAKQRAGRRPGR